MSQPGIGSREAILGKIRDAALRGGSNDADRRAEVEKRLGLVASHLLPERVRVGKAALTKLFRGYLEGQSATVIEVASKDDIPAAIARFLREANLPARLRHGNDAYLAGLDWSKEPQLERKSGHAVPTDEVGLTHALAGVAETGTLVFASGPENPVTLNYLPETSIAVVREVDIVDAYETAWQRIRELYGAGVMPRTVNLISGPSRTADIGGKLVIGAHGPRNLCVLIVTGE